MRTRSAAMLITWALLVSNAACVPAPAAPAPTLTPTAVGQPPQATAMPYPEVSATVAPALPTATLSNAFGMLRLVGEVNLSASAEVGRNPQALAVLGGRVYVANRGSSNVSVVEGGIVTSVIPVPKSPVAIAADKSTGMVYVAHESEDLISIISADGVLRTAPAPRSPVSLACLDGRVYVGGRGESSLVVLDGVTGERITALPLQAPVGILALAINPVMHLLYASVYEAIEIVDTDKLESIGRVDLDVYVALAADPLSARFFVSEYESSSNTHDLVAYDAMGRNKLGNVRIGGDPRSMAVDPGNGRIYVANSWTNDVSIIDGLALQLVATVPVGLRPQGVVVGSDGQVYVANSGSDNVAVLDGKTAQLSRTIPLSPRPLGMAVDRGTGRVYVACAGLNSVQVLEAGRVVDEVRAGLHPSEVALAQGGNALYVLNYVDGTVSLLSTRDDKLVRTASIGRLPTGLAVASELDQVYVGDRVLDGTGLQPVRTTDLVTAYGAVAQPVRVQTDNSAGRAYVTASNGVPGSNSGLVVYIVDLRTGERIPGQIGGLSVTDLVLDTEQQRIFSTAGRFGSYGLIVDDAGTLKRVAGLGLTRYPAALAYNPKTHHIVVCLTFPLNQTEQGRPQLLVLDSRGLGTVANVLLPGDLAYDESYRMAVDDERGFVYISDTRRGSVHILRDVTMSVPPSPVPTLTATPWPTLTPEPVAIATPMVKSEAQCTVSLSPLFRPLWIRDTSLRVGLGCPTEPSKTGFTAEQPFQHGYMFWREIDRRILVLYDNGQWQSFEDHWQEGMSDYACSATGPEGLEQPKRGFGLLWCSEQGVREAVGWATQGERGFSDEWQAFELGQMVSSQGRGGVYVLFADGGYLELPMP